VHNYFARVNRRAPSAPAWFGVAEFFACARVKRAQAFFCFYVRSYDSIGISRISYKEAQKFSEPAERLRAARCLRTEPAADNAVGGGAYTQN
jgi:hypothetical protein